ncbi:MAG: ATPase domain-containing protein [Thermoplasmatota archaeon]
MDSFGMDVSNQVIHDKRISTGIKGLDPLVSGGFLQGSVVLVSGTPGTGKTIVCFQYIQQGIKNGEKCLYFTSDERVHSLIHQANELGFNFQQYIDSGQLTFRYLDLDKRDVHKEMDDILQTGSFSRVVLDSLTPLSEIPVWLVNKGNEIIPSEVSFDKNTFPVNSIQATRTHVRRLISLLSNNECTTLVTSEIPEGSHCLSRDSISEFLVDGIIILDLDVTMDRRKLTIRKMRGTKHTLKPQNISIDTTGIKIV